MPVLRGVEGSGPSTQSAESTDSAEPTDGAVSVDGVELRLPEGRLVAGRYRVGPPLGGGRSSQVYWAMDEVLDRPVAVKVFAVARGPEGGLAVGALREARLLARLGHPHLVDLYDAGHEDGIGWVVMRLVPGGTLSGPGGAPQRRSPAEVARLGSEVADALDHAHRRGLVHRDVTPANVLVDADGRAVLGDFGIARAVDAAHTTAAGLVVGTPGYLSPEQVAGGHVTAASDVYSLGVVLVECLTGEREYDGTGVEAALARLSRPPRVPRGLPPALAGVLSAMTATDPALRPTAAQVRDRLAAVARTASAPRPPRVAVIAPLPGPAVGATRAMTLTRLAPVRTARALATATRDDDRPPSGMTAIVAAGAAGVLALVVVVGGVLAADPDAERSSGAGTRTSGAPSAVLARAATSPTPTTAASTPPRHPTAPAHGHGKGHTKHHH